MKLFPHRCSPLLRSLGVCDLKSTLCHHCRVFLPQCVLPESLVCVSDWFHQVATSSLARLFWPIFLFLAQSYLCVKTCLSGFLVLDFLYCPWAWATFNFTALVFYRWQTHHQEFRLRFHLCCTSEQWGSHLQAPLFRKLFSKWISASTVWDLVTVFKIRTKTFSSLVGSYL